MGLLYHGRLRWIFHLLTLTVAAMSNLNPTITPPPDLKLRARQTISTNFIGYTLYEGHCKPQNRSMGFLQVYFANFALGKGILNTVSQARRFPSLVPGLLALQLTMGATS